MTKQSRGLTRSLCAVTTLLAIGGLAACGGQLASAPHIPAATASIVTATKQYVNGPGADVLLVNRSAAAALASHSPSSCRTDVQNLAKLGNTDDVISTLAGTPDPHLAELLADELSILGGVLTACQHAVPASGALRQLTLVHDTINQRLKDDGTPS